MAEWRNGPYYQPVASHAVGFTLHGNLCLVAAGKKVGRSLVLTWDLKCVGQIACAHL